MQLPVYEGPIVNDSVDTNRWDLVPPRPGDIIVATSPKMGTTWTQMLCALLVHGPKLPLPLVELSPWLDGGSWDYVENAVDTFNAQPWRRVIKTHTPLKALKFRQDAFYVRCGRDPRDAFLSSLDHGENSALYGEPADVPTDRNSAFASALDFTQPRNLSSRFDYVAEWWRFRKLPNVLFLHYSDMTDSLESEAARLAHFLGLVRSQEEIKALVGQAHFAAMRADAHKLAPGAKVLGRWKSNADFFRKGRRGEWRDVLNPEIQDRYIRVTRGYYDAQMLDWIEGGRSATGDPRQI